MKNLLIAIGVLIILGAIGTYFYLNNQSPAEIEPTETEEPISVEPDEGIGDGAEGPDNGDEESEDRPAMEQIGTSAGGNAIEAHHFGSGDTEILLVGGVHGGYSQNTADLAEAFIDHFQDNESSIPDNLMVTIIPAVNPDGLGQSGAAGRFNANDVDLNRNFDCEWSAEGTWRQQTVSGGDAPFSEPEAAALRDYVNSSNPDAAIVWFSAEGRVYPSACGGNPSDASIALSNTFATAADYPTANEFDAYAITGDMVNWMAKENIPAISVLLSDHQSTQWSKNIAGLEAVLNAYAE